MCLQYDKFVKNERFKICANLRHLRHLRSFFSTKFVKKYRDLHSEILGAVKEYINDVQGRNFPSQEHTFKIEEGIIEQLYPTNKKAIV